MIKNFKQIVFIFILATLFVQCTDSEDIDFDKPDVKLFVQQVKTNTYAAESAMGVVEVPLFSKKDIPQLLMYAKDNTPIRKYPANPVASIVPDYYRLSICLLWTIEKIRLEQYPSLIPELYKQTEADGQYIAVAELSDIMEVWELYNKWWNKAENDSGIYQTNPLAGSIYSWTK